MPEKIKCGRCNKNMSNKRYSEKQLNDARWQIEDRGRIHTPIKCRTCTGGGHIFELECMMCNKTKGLKEFSKTQRKADDPVGNRLAGNGTTVLIGYRNVTSASRSRLLNSLSTRTSTRTRTLRLLPPITQLEHIQSTSRILHPPLERPPLMAGDPPPKAKKSTTQRAPIRAGACLYTAT